MGKLNFAAAVAAAVLGAFGTAHADNVGDMETVTRTVYGTPPSGQQVAKHPGDGVVFQENIETWTESGARLRFIDGSHLTLGAKAKVLIDQFVFDPSKAQGNALIKISVGSLRWVTGAMPKGQTVIKTPVATLTLRGTDVTVDVHPDGTTDTTVNDGQVDNHNDLTNTDTTMGPGDSQTSDQTGNHDTNNDANGNLGDQGDQGGGNGTTPEQRRSPNPINGVPPTMSPPKPSPPSTSECEGECG